MHYFNIFLINVSYLLRDIKEDTKKDESNYTTIKGK